MRRRRFSLQLHLHLRCMHAWMLGPACYVQESSLMQHAMHTTCEERLINLRYDLPLPSIQRF
jgi:hypothetical protein